MSPSSQLPVLLDRLAVEAATAPDALWRDLRFVGGVLCTVPFTLPWIEHPFSAGALLAATMALVPVGFTLVIAALWWQRRRRHRHLQRVGQRHAAAQLRSVTVNWKRRSKVYRWAVVAQWQGADGAARAAWSGCYDYDPQPLLAGRSGVVLAGPHDQVDAILLPDGLPPRRYRDLDASARKLTPQNPMLREYRMAALSAVVLLLVMIGIACLTLWPGFLPAAESGLPLR